MITVVGLGFVGLTTALGLAEKGFKVHGFDSNRDKVNAFARSNVPFHEPSLKQMLEKHLGTNFVLSRDLRSSVRDSEVIFLCVGTPSLHDGGADLTQLLTAFDACAPSLRQGSEYKIFAVKSTVPPGTTAKGFCDHVRSRGFVPGSDIGVCNNPEFLREGHAWEDFIHPDRIVIGTSDLRSAEKMTAIYGKFGAPVHVVSLNTGEFIKYLSNSMLATMISFANEMSMIAYQVGDIDIRQAFRALHQDKRWSGTPANMATYVYPGCGYGGYCLPKDTLALERTAKANDYDASLIREVAKVNDKVREFLCDLVCEKPGSGVVGILGLAFKPNSDDVRDSPAAAFIRNLKARGVEYIVAYDPVANDAFEREFRPGIQYADSIPDLVETADKIVVLAAWPQFQEASALLKTKELFDFRYFIG